MNGIARRNECRQRRQRSIIVPARVAALVLGLGAIPLASVSSAAAPDQWNIRVIPARETVYSGSWQREALFVRNQAAFPRPRPPRAVPGRRFHESAQHRLESAGGVVCRADCRQPRTLSCGSRSSRELHDPDRPHQGGMRLRPQNTARLAASSRVETRGVREPPLFCPG